MRSLILRLVIFFSTLIYCKALTCYTCNSIELPACATTLIGTDLPFEDCRMSLQCLTTVVDSVTYRGCSNKTPIIGATVEKYCEGNLCNKGVFPPGRLKCHKCSGTECAEKPSNKPEPCLSYGQTDECYVEVVSTELVKRGCRSDADHNQTENAIYCNYNGCNDQIAVQKVLCAQCDSAVALGCKRDLVKLFEDSCQITQYQTCEITSTLIEPETCFLYHKLDRVVRGCTQFIPEEMAEDKQNILECNESDLCNAKCLPRQECFECDSREVLSCRTNITDIRTSYCGSPEVSSCYVAEYSDGSVSRGCKSPTNTINITRTYECDGNSCNSILYKRCYQCSSDLVPACENFDMPGFGIEVEKCENPDAACITALWPNGTVLRGCENDMLDCNGSYNECKRCTSNFCNKWALHEHIRCYQCQGLNECNAALIGKPTPCANMLDNPVYEKQSCLYYNDKRLGPIYACGSNTTLYYQCLFTGTGCKLCYEDGCNKA